jgi:hypothetical protein
MKTLRLLDYTLVNDMCQAFDASFLFLLLIVPWGINLFRKTMSLIVTILILRAVRNRLVSTAWGYIAMRCGIDRQQKQERFYSIR